MLENTLRIVFYSINDIGKLFLTKAIADTGEYSEDDDADQDLEDEIEEESKFESVEDYGTEAEVDPEFWANFDLQQEKYVPGLDLEINAPLIIIPNLNVEGSRFEVDFGYIKIMSEQAIEKGRWVNHPEKEFRTMAIRVHS